MPNTTISHELDAVMVQYNQSLITISIAISVQEIESIQGEFQKTIGIFTQQQSENQFEIIIAHSLWTYLSSISIKKQEHIKREAEHRESAHAKSISRIVAEGYSLEDYEYCF